MTIEDDADLHEVYTEIAAVVRQVNRVDFNSNAVEAAIRGKGTYRGYSGEDVFLKNNLRVVQKEMVKQLRKRERTLTHRKWRLEAKLGMVAPASPNPAQAPANADATSATADKSPTEGNTVSPPPEPARHCSPSPAKAIAAVSKSEITRLPAVVVPAEISGRSRKRVLLPYTSAAPEPAPPSQISSTTPVAAAAQRQLIQLPTETAPPTAAAVPPGAAATLSGMTETPADQQTKSTIDTQGAVVIEAHSSVSTKPPSFATDSIAAGLDKHHSNGCTVCAAVVPAGKQPSTEGKQAAAPALDGAAAKSSGSGTVAVGPSTSGAGRGGVGGDDVEGDPPRTKRASKTLLSAASSVEAAAAAVSPRRKYTKRKPFVAPTPRAGKWSRRGKPAPGPAHSVQEFLGNTQRGIKAAASVKKGTVFWIKFSDTKEAWLECGVVKKVHAKSKVPYEVEWRPFDSTGCRLALNPKTRIALTPRLYAAMSDGVKAREAGAVGPPAGTKDRDNFQLSKNELKLNLPPIGSWSIAKPSQPWGELGPFAV